MKVDNAIILAAGTSSRFAPLSFEKHKAFTEVKGELLIERQIRQLSEAGVKDIYIVTGYKAEQFDYLKDKYGVQLIHNADYARRNNNSSIWVAKDVISNSYICSSDNYFLYNPFEKEVDSAYYASLFSEGTTQEWCMRERDGTIDSVTIGGENAWYMIGHVFWDEEFSEKFIRILNQEYELPETADKLWENIYIEHLDELKLKIKKYPPDYIYEFDTLDELRQFDASYIEDTRSFIVKQIASDLKVKESAITHVEAYKGRDNCAEGFAFLCNGKKYRYSYEKKELVEIKGGLK